MKATKCPWCNRLTMLPSKHPCLRAYAAAKAEGARDALESVASFIVGVHIQEDVFPVLIILDEISSLRARAAQEGKG